MATGLRFPLGQPDAEGYADTYDETRTSVDMDAGTARVRNKMRTAPRSFDVTWKMKQDQYVLFDNWWQNAIKGGVQLFDVQLLDDDEILVWYTVRWIGKFTAVIDSNTNEWRVSGKLRTTSDSFLVRLPGTNELGGRARVGVSASAKMLIGKTLNGRASLGLSSASANPAAIPLNGRVSLTFNTVRARLTPRPFYGRAVFSLTASANPATFGADELILQFDAVTYTPPTGDVVDLQFDSTVYYPPHII